MRMDVPTRKAMEAMPHFIRRALISGDGVPIFGYQVRVMPHGFEILRLEVNMSTDNGPLQGLDTDLMQIFADTITAWTEWPSAHALVEPFTGIYQVCQVMVELRMKDDGTFRMDVTGDMDGRASKNTLNRSMFNNLVASMAAIVDKRTVDI